MDAEIKGAQRAVEAHLDHVLAPFGTSDVAEAMRHATRGGKRLRACLVLQSAKLHGVSEAQAIWPATAIEAMHAYSLVHDDLPCMDDDDARRGQPTVHVKWDEMTAVLTGDALQALAFQLAAHPEAGSAEVRADLALSLARAAGAQGMVLGQALDMAAERPGAALDLEQISALQAGKTGALFEWSAGSGARMAGADPGPMIRYAAAMGQAFQIHDDVIDVTGDAASAGKAVGKDAAAGKATFVSLLGLDGARARAEALVDEADAALSPYGEGADPLRRIARFAISRDN
ncbi:farnesyl diphosphate synthase [Roseovarius nanhaiticus]|uniref:Geranylgeranyl diphosphate synthase n=1 Tax=Roseovarius nanhaiticus TaxID=573024 RepID=A0A1N7GG08_9RHOB|nr:polyprenyl synthetase family protein [Roseovarius nanhaiticus]SEK27249.1 farnesyl diphosphate synthase [Roseovarius nanhaiticus]SIS11468.1 farnesyl diphosphate synthase [Roseovarius nanhaiticus]